MIAFLILLAAVQVPTAEQTLNEASSAFQRGDEVTGRRKLKEAQTLADRDTEALTSRLSAHARWDDCIKATAARVSSQNEHADVLADAVLGMCLEDENLVRARQTQVDRYIDGLEGSALSEEVDKDMAGWRTTQRQTALGIIVNARTATNAIPR